MRPASLFLAFLLGASLVSGTVPALAQQGEAAALTVTAAKPAERQWPETVPASGWLKPWHEAVIAAEVGGLRVTNVLVDVGSVVTKGQPLLRKEEAALDTAKADLAKAKANADRARQVQGSGALSDEKITEYLIAEQTATAGVASAEASLESQRIKLAQTTIVTVDDGLITARSAQLGAVVSSGTELFRLVRQQRVEWQAEVSARYLPRIREGLTAAISGPGDRRIEGNVRLVGPTVSIDTGRALAYVALPAEDHPPVGLYVTGEVELETTAALTMPETALVLRDGIAYVFTVDKDNRAARSSIPTRLPAGHKKSLLGYRTSPVSSRLSAAPPRAAVPTLPPPAIRPARRSSSTSPRSASATAAKPRSRTISARHTPSFRAPASRWARAATARRWRSRSPATIPPRWTRPPARWSNSCAPCRASAPSPPAPRSRPRKSRSCPISTGQQHSA